MDELSHKKRSRVDSSELVSEFESTKAKKMRDQLLSLLDDSDTVPDRDPVSQNHDLDSVIRSFEEEISGSGSSSPAADPITVFDLETGSGEILPDVDELTRVGTELQGIGELWDFQDDLLSYDPFRFGLDNNTDSVANVTGEVGGTENGKEYVSLDGIFDYSDENFGSDFSWRYETLPAL
ncbi:uncharacterized protein LOC141598916 [Silene latifolia]|uniref:uncharacterized protein LOC141598916 n=1 Tax=Silene latifolia TaxID=37657 RepID=UPI003D76F0C4